jgi:hypothetical protein
MNAAEARKKSDEIQQLQQEVNMSAIREAISNAVNGKNGNDGGKYSCYYYGKIRPDNWFILEKEGYKILQSPQAPTDTEPSYEIFW